ncbi:MAG: queuosine precursor transporter [Actinomycetaceae bacterium]|nr:queuosine precursor transporter [Actinomycetaceae bacterium]
MDTQSTSPITGIPRFYDIIAVAFVGFLLLSNVTATKLIEVPTPFAPLIFDGGAILFPFTYILGDVLAEIYGFARARRVILIGFVMSFVASFIFLLVQIAPPAADYHNQAAFEAVLGFVPRIVTASLFAYLAGQLLNSYVLVAIKRRLGEKNLWVRLIGSTLVGEAADTIIFCTIAFLGVLTGGAFWNYVVVGYVYKCAVEVICLPLTYAVIAWMKRHEPAWKPADTLREDNQ